jgi:glycerate 2-kinase
MSSQAGSFSLSCARSDLLRIYAAAIAAVRPEKVVGEALAGAIDPAIAQSIGGATKIRVLAAGKAALGMTLAIQRRIGSRIGETLVIAPAPMPVHAPEQLRVITGAHPLPDESSEIAGRAALKFVTRSKAGELILFLLSGGASALMVVPAAGIRLTEKVAVSAALMRAGASITELNAVRKHLSAIKGGGLVRELHPDARIVSLILSDVPGNDPATIGSGPAVADPTTFGDAIAVLKRRKLWGRTPEAVRDRLERGAAGEIPETLKRFLTTRWRRRRRRRRRARPAMTSGDGAICQARRI